MGAFVRTSVPSTGVRVGCSRSNLPRLVAGAGTVGARLQGELPGPEVLSNDHESGEGGGGHDSLAEEAGA